MKKSGAGGIQHVMPSFCLLTAADTPGFGNLLAENIDARELYKYFREFKHFEHGCKFVPCTHTHEPVCGVKNAVEEGKIAASRYESYLAILDEIKLLKEKSGKR